MKYIMYIDVLDTQDTTEVFESQTQKIKSELNRIGICQVAYVMLCSQTGEDRTRLEAIPGS